ncbi:1245_t:CDS:2 [Paraglomus brasilianum]|uniref:1245_t:CDS:1 n=1 Tax=Paraglomus brasilianum TaxID=144538 RepID=A0A9N8VUG6_9GLOM|nr:1245_t:CDS:2 [Paraglomus brasilianum]
MDYGHRSSYGNGQEITRDVRVVVSIGFSYANKKNPDIPNTYFNVNINRPEQTGVFKTNSALLYDENFNVIKWGYPAIAQEPRKKTRRDAKNQMKPINVDLFKLHMGNIREEDRPRLPNGLTYNQACADYLREFNKVIKEKITARWPGIQYPKQCLFVMTVPAEWNDETRGIMRDIAAKAGILEDVYADNLEFTTEPEAAAVHCISSLKEYDLLVGSSFMIVDCGGGTVDLTTRMLLPGNRLSEITIRSGDFCGSSFVDKQFVLFIGGKFGLAALKKLNELHYGQLQYLVQHFCSRVKFSFNGNPATYKPRSIDIESTCPAAMDYVTGALADAMDAAEWEIELSFEDVKRMFDPVVNRILELIQAQLVASNGQCQAIFMVGGFAENQYLQNRVKDTFSSQVRIIAVPRHPIAAVSRGALAYGLNMNLVQTRVLKWTYGVETYHVWKSSDPVERRTPRGFVMHFKRLAQRGLQVAVDQKFSYQASSLSPQQTEMLFHVFVTQSDDAVYCDEPGMRLLGKLQIYLSPPRHLQDNRHVEFSLMFGKMEVKAIARNTDTGEICHTSFVLDI